MLAEIRLFSLASDLFWGLWSVVNAKLSQIPFGYWDYAAARLRHYQYTKEKFLVSGPLFPESGIKRKVTQLD
jgi:choline/ethanolamine kinase